MEIALLHYDGMATLDAIGPYEVLRNVPGWEIRTVAPRKGEVRDERGTIALVADKDLPEVTSADIVVVPGGRGNRPLLLGAAGLLEGKRATSNWLELDELRAFGADPVGGRFVEDGKTITAAGVTAGIDMALHLVSREVGPEVAQAIQLGIEYDPDPPFDSGSPQKAPPEIVELVRSVTAAARS